MLQQDKSVQTAGKITKKNILFVSDNNNEYRVKPAIV